MTENKSRHACKNNNNKIQEQLYFNIIKIDKPATNQLKPPETTMENKLDFTEKMDNNEEFCMGTISLSITAVFAQVPLLYIHKDLCLYFKGVRSKTAHLQRGSL